MHSQVEIRIDGKIFTVPADVTVAVALALADAHCHSPISGQPRGPLCAMGICFECRVRIDGVPHQRSCQVVCRQGMDVWTR